jgi:ADP-ribose pyrophosphatase YjhB (NUDIX family)
MVSSVGELDDWRFCPRCGEAIEKKGGHARCVACGFRAWAKPAPGAEAVILDAAGRVLLGRRALEPAVGLWDLPGGFLEEHEHPLAGLHREVQEETGLEIEPQAFVGFYLEPYESRTVLCLTWLAKVAGGQERAGDDIAELRWFAPGELPLDELAYSHHRQALSDAFGHEDT